MRVYVRECVGNHVYGIMSRRIVLLLLRRVAYTRALFHKSWKSSLFELFPFFLLAEWVTCWCGCCFRFHTATSMHRLLPPFGSSAFFLCPENLPSFSRPKPRGDHTHADSYPSLLPPPLLSPALMDDNDSTSSTGLTDAPSSLG